MSNPLRPTGNGRKPARPSRAAKPSSTAGQSSASTPSDAALETVAQGDLALTTASSSAAPAPAPPAPAPASEVTPATSVSTPKSDAATLSKLRRDGEKKDDAIIDYEQKLIEAEQTIADKTEDEAKSRKRIQELEKLLKESKEEHNITKAKLKDIAGNADKARTNLQMEQMKHNALKSRFANSEKELEKAVKASRDKSEELRHVLPSKLKLQNEYDAFKAEYGPFKERAEAAEKDLGDLEGELRTLFEQTPDMSLETIVQNIKTEHEAYIKPKAEDSDSVSQDSRERRNVSRPSLGDELDSAGYVSDKESIDGEENKDQDETITIDKVPNPPKTYQSQGVQSELQPQPQKLGLSEISAISTSPIEPTSPEKKSPKQNLGFSIISSTSTRPIYPLRTKKPKFGLSEILTTIDTSPIDPPSPPKKPEPSFTGVSTTIDVTPVEPTPPKQQELGMSDITTVSTSPVNTPPPPPFSFSELHTSIDLPPPFIPDLTDQERKMRYFLKKERANLRVIAGRERDRHDKRRDRGLPPSPILVSSGMQTDPFDMPPPKVFRRYIVQPPVINTVVKTNRIINTVTKEIKHIPLSWRVLFAIACLIVALMFSAIIGERKMWNEANEPARARVAYMGQTGTSHWSLMLTFLSHFSLTGNGEHGILY